jgi:hypothetical protein
MNGKQAVWVSARVRKLLTSDRRDRKDTRYDFDYCSGRRGNCCEDCEDCSGEDKDTRNGHGAPGICQVVVAAAAMRWGEEEEEEDGILGIVDETVPAAAELLQAGSTASGNP